MLGLLASGEPLRAAEPVVAVTRTASEAKLTQLTITVNKSRTQRLSFPFQEVLVGQPDVADVIPISDQTLYILGKRVGSTSVSVFNAEKQLVGVVDIKVNPEVVSGVSPDAVAVEQAVSLAPPTTVNVAKVKSPQQVMLKVRIAEVNRNAARALGVQYSFLEGANPRPPAALIGGNVNSQQGINTLFPQASPLSSTSAPYVSARFGIGNVEVNLEALEQKGLARTLAEPNLTALSGETARFLAGGEFPVTTVGNDGQINVEYKEFGVKLLFTPTVLERGLINLRVIPEVSDIASFSPSGFPIFSTRRASTAVELRDGQSFALAGMLQTTANRDTDQVPWLGSIPVIGALFRSQAFQNSETELVVIVTPHLVKPAKPGQPLKIPQDTTVPANDVDQFLVGDLEIKKRPAENGPQQPLGSPPRGQYGHILTARPPVVKVPVVAPTAPASIKPAGKATTKVVVEPVASAPAAVVR
jgi:pilus assembly protein CpaC